MTATGSIAIGESSTARGNSSMALGPEAKANDMQSIALGASANASGIGALAVGSHALTDGHNAIVIGNVAHATGPGAVALGYLAAADAANVVAIGTLATASGANSVALGANSVADRADAVAIGNASPNSQRQLIHVKAGTQATDAVNISQLKPALDALGATFNDVDGSVSAPSYNVGGATVHTVGAALSNLDGRVTINTSDIDTLKSQIGEGGIGLVQQDAGTGNITVAAATGGSVVDFHGTGGERVLTGVKRGAINDQSSDAVNGAQLFETNQDVIANTVAITELGGHVDTHATHITNLQKQVGGSVQYDDHVARDRITLGGTDARAGAAPVTLSNVANGKDLSDAVTIAQLKAAGVYDPVNDRILGALVYDDITLATATLGGSSGTVLDNLKGGLIAAGSMQAVNGGQMHAMQQYFQSKYDSLDGRVTLIEQGVADGSIGGPGNGGGDAEYGPGSGSGDNSLVVGKGADASGSNSSAIGNGSVASGENSTALGADANATGNNAVALGAGSVADRDNSVSVGSEGQERQITNVAAGTQRTDAANWGQVQDAVNDVRDWANQKFTQIDKRINRMGAMSAAYGQMAFSAQGLETKNRLGVGVGSQGGQSALAVGYSRQIKPNLNVSFGGSASAGDVSMGAGVAVGW
jgi:autotransporter adhesin